MRACASGYSHKNKLPLAYSQAYTTIHSNHQFRVTTRRKLCQPAWHGMVVVKVSSHHLPRHTQQQQDESMIKTSFRVTTGACMCTSKGSKGQSSSDFEMPKIITNVVHVISRIVGHGRGKPHVTIPEHVCSLRTMECHLRLTNNIK